jgi:hypothetical protein
VIVITPVVAWGDLSIGTLKISLKERSGCVEIELAEANGLGERRQKYDHPSVEKSWLRLYVL